jgi:hypothetical protein
VEEQKNVLTLMDKAEMFSQYQIGAFFAGKAGGRRVAANSANRAKWRGR